MVSLSDTCHKDFHRFYSHNALFQQGVCVFSNINKQNLNTACMFGLTGQSVMKGRDTLSLSWVVSWMTLPVAVVEGHQEKYTNNPKNISWIKYFMCCFRIIFGLLVTAQVDNVWVLLHWTICKYSFPNDQILVNMMTKYHTLTMFMWMFEWMVWYGNSGFTIHSWPRCPSRPDGDIRPEAIFSTSFGSSRTASHRLVTCTCQIWISGWILPHFDVRTISVASKLKKLQIFLYY